MTTIAALPVVAVVGRPNVGKSTLVNRFVGRRDAIVEEKPGVTRDRKTFEADWNGRSFIVVDTGGWLSATSEAGSHALARQVSLQAERAVADADVILLVVDVNVGITEEDAQVAQILRRTDKPVILVTNKADDDRRENEAWTFARLGLGDPHPVSAIHGRGSGDLLDVLVDALPPIPEEPEPEDPADKIFSVAIVGRPNVGKSTLFNRIVGDERSIVHDMPGTTRDAVDTVIDTEDGPLRFVDTAGMRRRGKIDEPTEYFSLVRALQAVDRSDAALLVVDAHEGVSHQDQRLAERVDAAGTAIVIVLNKWDLLDAEGRAKAKIDVADRLAFLAYAPGPHRLRPHRQDDAAGAPGPAPGRGGVPPAGSHRRPEPGAARRPGQPSAAGDRSATDPGCSTPPRAPTIRPPSPCSPPTSSRRRTSGTWSARSARRSTSARRR